MSKKEAYKQKITAELELAQAKLSEFKARAKNAEADVRVQYAKQGDELEQKVAETKTKLKQLGEANDDTWHHLKEGVESAWNSLSAAIRDAAAKLKS